MEPPKTTVATPPTGDRRVALWGILVVAAAMALYRPSLNANFINLDDPQYIADNVYVLRPSWAHFAAFFSEVLRPTMVGGYYQPLTMVSLMFDRVIEGLLAGGPPGFPQPFVYHLSNVILHGLNAGLVYLLTLAIAGQRRIAVLCALIFAAHPLNVEVVSWVCQRKALLSTTFAVAMVLAYGCYARALQGRRVSAAAGWYAAVFAAYVLSLLAKPTGLFLPLILLLADIWPLQRRSWRAVLEKLPLLVLSAIFGWIAYDSQAATSGLAENVLKTDPLRAVLIVCHNLVFYIAKFLLPIRLSPQYPLPPDRAITVASPAFLFGLLGTALVVAILILSWRRRWRAVGVTLAAYILAVAPALGPIRFMGAIAADRFAYMPMIAFICLLADAMRRRFDTRNASTIGVPVVACLIGLAALCVYTWRQQDHWQTSETYYASVLRYYPEAPVAHHGLGCWYLEEHDRFLRDPHADPSEGPVLLEKALAKFRHAIELEPNYGQSYTRICEILLVQGKPDEALKYVEKSLSFEHPDIECWFFLGLCYSRLNRYADAIEPYAKFLEMRPNQREALRNIGNALLRTEQPAKAIPYYARLFELDDEDVDGMQNLGVALIRVERAKAAVFPLQRAVFLRTVRLEQLDERDTHRAEEVANLGEAKFALATALAMAGDTDHAWPQLLDAVRLKPDLRSRAETWPSFESLRHTDRWSELNRAGPHT